MKSGIIKLYNSAGHRLAIRRYSDSGSNRLRGVLKQWQEMYGDKYRTFYYHLEPDTEDIAEIINRKLNNVA